MPMYGNGSLRRFARVHSFGSLGNGVGLRLISFADADQQMLAVGRNGHGRWIPASGNKALHLAAAGRPKCRRPPRSCCRRWRRTVFCRRATRPPRRACFLPEPWETAPYRSSRSRHRAWCRSRKRHWSWRRPRKSDRPSGRRRFGWDVRRRRSWPSRANQSGSIASTTRPAQSDTYSREPLRAIATSYGRPPIASVLSGCPPDKSMAINCPASISSE